MGMKDSLDSDWWKEGRSVQYVGRRDSVGRTPNIRRQKLHRYLVPSHPLHPLLPLPSQHPSKDQQQSPNRLSAAHHPHCGLAWD